MSGKHHQGKFERKKQFHRDGDYHSQNSHNAESSGKSYGKKGVVAPNIFAYYQRCGTVLKADEFHDDDAKGAFVSSVFEQLVGDGFKVLQNQTLSRIVESFLGYADFETLDLILTTFRKNWDSSVTDRFAHRVLQRTLEVYQNLFHTASENGDLENNYGFKKANSKVSEFCAHMYEHYPQYIQSQQGSFILRTWLKLICGIRVRVIGPTEEVDLLTPIMENYKSVIKNFLTTFLYSPHLQVSIDDPLTNLFIQMIMMCVSYRLPKKMRKLIKYFIGDSDLFKNIDDDLFSTLNVRIPTVFNSRQGSYFMERMIRLMPSKYLNTFFETYVKDSIEVLVLNSVSSFIIQRVIERADDDLFLKITRSLASQTPAIFAEGQLGVLAALIKRGCDVPEAQRQLVSALRRCLRCNADDPASQTAFLSCLSRLRIYGTEEDEDQINDDAGDGGTRQTFSHHGSLITQNILNYKKTGFIIRSFLSTPTEELLKLGQDMRGSHIFDALFNSSTVSLEKKLEIVDYMKPVLCQISCNKYGSRIMDSLWANLDSNGKFRVAAVLAEHKDKLRNDRFGNFVCRKYSLLMFHRKREWLKVNSDVEILASKKIKSS